MKLALRELEQLRRNPRLFGQARKGFSKLSKNRVLHYAVYKYHMEHEDLARAIAYFEEMYQRTFKRTEDIDKWLNELTKYDAAYKGERYLKIRTRHRISIVIDDVELTGEIPRLDMDQSGEREYAVWLFARGAGSWRDELRMPLIQAGTAEAMRVASNRVSVGVYDFSVGAYDRECFAVGEIARAREELTQLAVEIRGLNE